MESHRSLWCGMNLARGMLAVVDVVGGVSSVGVLEHPDLDVCQQVENSAVQQRMIASRRPGLPNTYNESWQFCMDSAVFGGQSHGNKQGNMPSK